MESAFLYIFGGCILFWIFKRVSGVFKGSKKIPALHFHSERNPTDPTDTAKKYCSLSEWEHDPRFVTKGNGETIEFSYESYDGEQTTIEFDLHAILKSPDERIYIWGFCHLRKKERTLNVDRIITLIKFRSKRYDVYEYFKENYGASVF